MAGPVKLLGLAVRGGSELLENGLTFAARRAGDLKGMGKGLAESAQEGTTRLVNNISEAAGQAETATRQALVDAATKQDEVVLSSGKQVVKAAEPIDKNFIGQFFDQTKKFFASLWQKLPFTQTKSLNQAAGEQSGEILEAGAQQFKKGVDEKAGELAKAVEGKVAERLNQFKDAISGKRLSEGVIADFIKGMPEDEIKPFLEVVSHAKNSNGDYLLDKKQYQLFKNVLDRSGTRDGNVIVTNRLLKRAQNDTARAANAFKRDGKRALRDTAVFVMPAHGADTLLRHGGDIFPQADVGKVVADTITDTLSANGIESAKTIATNAQHLGNGQTVVDILQQGVKPEQADKIMTALNQNLIDAAEHISKTNHVHSLAQGASDAYMNMTANGSAMLDIGLNNLKNVAANWLHAPGIADAVQSGPIHNVAQWLADPTTGHELFNHLAQNASHLTHSVLGKGS